MNMATIQGEIKEFTTIDIFGDSLVRGAFCPKGTGFAGHIAERATDNFDVHVRGLEGYNSDMAVKQLHRLYPSEYVRNSTMLILVLGHFDSFKNSPFYVPVEKFTANLNTIIDYFSGCGLPLQQMILVSPSWYYQPDFNFAMKRYGLPPMSKTLDDAREYARAVTAVCEERLTHHVDFFTHSYDLAGRRLLFQDGFHLSPMGHKLMADLLMPVVHKIVLEAFGRSIYDFGVVSDQSTIRSYQRAVQNSFNSFAGVSLP